MSLCKRCKNCLSFIKKRQQGMNSRKYFIKKTVNLYIIFFLTILISPFEQSYGYSITDWNLTFTTNVQDIVQGIVNYHITVTDRGNGRINFHINPLSPGNTESPEIPESIQDVIHRINDEVQTLTDNGLGISYGYRGQVTTYETCIGLNILSLNGYPTIAGSDEYPTIGGIPGIPHALYLNSNSSKLEGFATTPLCLDEDEDEDTGFKIDLGDEESPVATRTIIIKRTEYHSFIIVSIEGDVSENIHFKLTRFSPNLTQ